jgi:hypothetical protein
MGLGNVVRRHRKMVLPLVFAGLLACVALGASFTGSYFSDAHNGTITGTIGTIRLTPGGPLDLSFNNLLPGVPQTVSQTYQNTGGNPEDVYLVFNNATALSALNNLGTFGEVHIDSSGTEIFASQNLNDNTTTCPPGSTAGGKPPCDAVPGQIELASNVAPGGTGSFSFTFMYASKLTGNGPGVWNTYPVTGQTTINDADGTGSGLPYQLVAVQVGQTP